MLAVLVASAPAAAPKGTLRVAAKADMTTLDTANAMSGCWQARLSLASRPRSER